ncbi:MAG: hypothetical protein GY772_29770, partial [bacterium]|nr:hypothetical protein [bacterium]
RHAMAKATVAFQRLNLPVSWCQQLVEVGAVREARTEASRILRDAIRQHGSRGNNKAIALHKMQDAGRLSQGQREEVEPKTKEHLNLLIHLRVLSQEVNSWSLEHCAERVATVMDNVARLATLDTWLDEKLQSARASATVAARAKALALRAERHAMAKATVAYQRLSLPVSWCHQLVDVGAVSNAADTYKPSKPEASDLNWTVPMWFGAESEGVGTALRSLRSACGAERVTQALVKLAMYVASGESVSMLLMTPRGAGRDTVETLAWVPKELAAVPEALRSFGAPWLFTQCANAHRQGDLAYPFPGLGHFLLGLEGKMLVITWPMRPLVSMGLEGQDMWKHMSSWPVDRLADFVEKNAVHFCLSCGASAWIPYGHFSLLVALPGSDRASVLFQPIVSAPLAKECDAAPLRVMKVWWENFGATTAVDKPWDTLLPAAIDWCGQVVRAAAEAASPAARLALEDGRVEAQASAAAETAREAGASAGASKASAPKPVGID